MVVYSFYIFDRHSGFSKHPLCTMLILEIAECIYSKLWHLAAPASASAPSVTKPSRPISDSSAASNGPVPDLGPARARPVRLSAQDDAKLIFGTIFSLRNMVRKLGGPDDRWERPSLVHGIISIDCSPASYHFGRVNTSYTTTKHPLISSL